MIAGTALMQTDLGLKLFARGKVRDTYLLEKDRLLMVATDRLSAFDHVLPTGIPDRGKVLTQLSIYWFSRTHLMQENHLISGMIPDLPEQLQGQREELAGRFMIVRRAERIDVECVVRGYLACSAWQEYRKKGTINGEKMPPGLRESEKLATPMFTPATKASSGHDLNISFKKMQKLVGAQLAQQLKEASLALYGLAAQEVERKGLILADTKFEFGQIEGRLILIDELLTPDSSRYWDAITYRPGTTPHSYDKQFVRDWLTQSGWDRNSEPPALPEAIVEQTRARYLTAYQLAVGKPLFPPRHRAEVR